MKHSSSAKLIRPQCHLAGLPFITSYACFETYNELTVLQGEKVSY